MKPWSIFEPKPLNRSDSNASPARDDLFPCSASAAYRRDPDRQPHPQPALLRARSRGLARLRRNTVGERVGMKISVVTQTGPGTVLLGGLRHAVLFTRGKAAPGFVAGV